MSMSDASISELNLSFLHVVREALLRHRVLAQGEFGIDTQVADLLLGLSPEQLRRLSQAKILLFGLRWRRHAVWTCLEAYAAGTATALPQALLVAEGEAADGYQA